MAIRSNKKRNVEFLGPLLRNQRTGLGLRWDVVVIPTVIDIGDSHEATLQETVQAAAFFFLCCSYLFSLSPYTAPC